MSALRSRQRGLCRRLTIRNSACFGIIVETGVFFSEMLVFMRPVVGKVGVDLPAASCYNICKEFYFIKFCGCRRPVLRTVAVLTASQKCPCKQAFLLHGIIRHGITLFCGCTLFYRVREFDTARQTPMLTRGRSTVLHYSAVARYFTVSASLTPRVKLRCKPAADARYNVNL